MADTIFYRTFKNMDGAGLCRVWNRSWYVNVWGEAVDEHSFDQFIASKLIFNPAHLVVAVEPLETPDPTGLADGRIVGFVHGGFGPNQEMNGCDKSVGYIAMLVVEQREDAQKIRARLLYEMEKVFFRLGIRRVFAGAVYPNAPFYTGRLFGCEPTGVLENDPFLPQILLKNHYIAVERHHILTFLLCDRLPLNFSQRVLAQSVELITPDEHLLRSDSAFLASETGKKVRPSAELIPQDWWDVCAHSNVQWSRFVMLDRATREPIAWVGVRVMTRSEKMTLLGLHHLYVKPQFRNNGFAKLLLTQVLNLLQMEFHSCRAELLVPEVNTSALQTFAGLHFTITSTGNVYQRDLPEDFLETDESEKEREMNA